MQAMPTLDMMEHPCLPNVPGYQKHLQPESTWLPWYLGSPLGLGPDGKLLGLIYRTAKLAG